MPKKHVHLLLLISGGGTVPFTIKRLSTTSIAKLRVSTFARVRVSCNVSRTFSSCVLMGCSGYPLGPSVNDWSVRLLQFALGAGLPAGAAARSASAGALALQPVKRHSIAVFDIETCEERKIGLVRFHGELTEADCEALEAAGRAVKDGQLTT
jgi:hypothetical protein